MKRHCTKPPLKAQCQKPPWGGDMKKIDLTGTRFERILVLGPSEKTNRVGALWECQCECGTRFIAESYKLRTGHTTSCGCHRRKALLKSRTIHGRANKSHTYRTWKEMRQRCMNPKSDKFHWYGGRGITICERWMEYQNFLSDMGERPTGMTLDRIDNDGPYSPENCRWATHIEQTRKQKKNVLSEELANQMRADRAAGMTFKQLGEKYGVSDTTAHRCCMRRTWA